MPRQSDYLRCGAALVIAGLCISSVRANVARLHAQAKETSDVNLLPPPDQVVALSLGYRAALADILWAQVLVGQGLRTMERRRYDTVTDLLDTINALDPQFRDPYVWSDALVTIQVGEATLEDVYRTRAILERGMKNRPLDPDLWRTAGQFITFIAPATFLKDEKEQMAWRLEGARILARSAEMGGDTGYAGWSAISSAGILSRQGERDAAIRLIQRTLAVTEDEELKDLLQRQLASLIGETKIEAYKRRQTELIEISRHDLPFVNKTTLHILGPPFDTAYCAGGKVQPDKRCAITWNAWAAADDAASNP
ncbi:MAG TPA: hypothetical protein PK156_41830 [Polyangium sp.]|nr:hypothetical protein [Polyangium sp.]